MTRRDADPILGRMSDSSQSVQFLKGAGPRKAERLARLGIVTVEDLLHHYPRTYYDRSQIKLVKDLQVGQQMTCQVDVKEVAVRPSARGMQNFHAILSDRSGSVQAIWFNQPYLRNYVKKGAKLMVSGEVGCYGRATQLRNPDYEEFTPEEEKLLHTGRIVPVYPLTAGVSQRLMRSWIRQALDLAGDLTDHLPPEIVQARSLPDLQTALRQIHFPEKWSERDRARQRFVYDELFVYHVFLLGQRRLKDARPGIPFAATGTLSRRVARALPFALTSAQKRVLIEIRDDMRLSRPMNRLLMGEVGSGKTVVALLAGCLAIEDRYQVALLSPTEILAEQHVVSLRRLLGETPVPVHLLSGRMRAAERREFLEAASGGEAGFYVGTHALIQEAVDFARLGLVVVDEQHRFGVRQRAELRAKGRFPDVLIMTATPIPRTLAMTLCGDLDISELDELPKGRGEVRTRVARGPDRESVYAFLRSEIERGHRAYVVYPVIEGSEKTDLKAATEGAASLTAHPAFRGFQVGLLHGQMKSEEKSAVMDAFREGRCPVLVTTTVIEVGVDVPEATVMLVEDPDRYGLSQLHQLRGRIGRGSARSTFILLADQHLSPVAFRRLQVLERTRSGVEIAREDLEIRGPGEVLGTRQHGLPDLQLADLTKDRDLLEVARADAKAMLESVPRLDRADLERFRRVLVARHGENAAFHDVG